jgi:anti-sigma factor RsiW
MSRTEKPKMSCDQTNLVHAYHDGELFIADRAAFEQHLQSCAECSALLADLQKLSTLIAAAPMANIPSKTLANLRQNQFVLPDAGVMRIAGWLTAAAAAVLVAALPFWPNSQIDSANALGSASPSLIQTIAVNPPAENAADVAHPDSIADAQWMADNFSVDQR